MGVGGMKTKNRKDRMQEQKNEWGKEAPEASRPYILCSLALPSPAPSLLCS